MTGHFFNTMSEDSVNDTDYSLIYKYEPKAQKEWHKRIAEGREQKDSKRMSKGHQKEKSFGRTKNLRTIRFLCSGIIFLEIIHPIPIDKENLIIY